MLKVGLIGCGGMGKVHANCYADLKDVAELVAVADLVQENLDEVATLTGARTYPDGNALLANEELDVIDICLPTFLHTEYAIKAMEAGSNVLIEKPVCLNPEEGKALLEAQERTGKKVQVGHVIRFWNEYIWLKNAVDSGAYGRVLSATFTRLSPNPRWSWENWFNDPERSGTAVLDLHIHDADFVRYLMGEPDEVNSFGARNSKGVLEGVTSIYRYGDVFVTAEGAWDYPDKFPFRMCFRVITEKATMAYENGKLTVYPMEGEPFEPELEKPDVEDVDAGINISDKGGYYNEIRYFLECVAEDKEILIAPLSEAVRSMELVQKEIALAGGKKR